MESLFSFPVGLFHPLQHAGLSRRTPSTPTMTGPGLTVQVELGSPIKRALLRMRHESIFCLEAQLILAPSFLARISVR
jgi:hypothetical protein